MKSINFIGKSIVLYGSLSTAFSLIGLLPIFQQFLPDAYIIGSPLEVSDPSWDHIAGHVAFGLMAGTTTLSMRYLTLAGIFPLALDADHLIQFLNLEAVPRMSHSFMFGLISVPIMMIALGKKDYLLGTVSFSAVLTHIALDILRGKGDMFPLLMPAQNELIVFGAPDWIPFMMIAAAIMGAAAFFAKRRLNTKPGQKT